MANRTERSPTECQPHSCREHAGPVIIVANRPRCCTGITPTGDDSPSPVALDTESEPVYGPTALDQRLCVLVDRYSSHQPNPDRMLVSDAFHAITASENLAHAEEAADVLRELVARAKHRDRTHREGEER